MKLAEYMRSSAISDEAFAALVGDCTPHAVKKWFYEERVPRPEQMRRIFEVTNGAVTPNDFIGVGPDASDVEGPAGEIPDLSDPPFLPPARVASE